MLGWSSSGVRRRRQRTISPHQCTPGLGSPRDPGALLLTGAHHRAPWRAARGCMPGKGHRQPQNRKENLNSPWEQMDRAGRGMRAGAGANTEGRRDLNVSFLEPRHKNPRRWLLRRMSLFFTLASTSLAFGKRVAEVTPPTAGAAPHPRKRLGLSLGIKPPQVR